MLVFVNEDGTETAIDQPVAGKTSENRLDVMRAYIFRNNARLQGPSTEFDFDPFARLTQVAETMAKKHVADEMPYWFLPRAIDTKFPNTVILHTRKCKVLEDPHATGIPNQAYKTRAVGLIDLTRLEIGSFPWQLKYCKECKKRIGIPSGYNVAELNRQRIEARLALEKPAERKQAEVEVVDSPEDEEEEEKKEDRVRAGSGRRRGSSSIDSTTVLERLTTAIEKLALNPKTASSSSSTPKSARPIAPIYTVGPFYNRTTANRYRTPTTRTQSTQ